MDADQELRDWAAGQNLSSDIVDVLEKERFDMETLRQLTCDDFKEFENMIQKPKLLPIAKCLKLKNALKTLSETPGHADMEQTLSSALVITPAVASPKAPSRDPVGRASAGQGTRLLPLDDPAQEGTSGTPQAGHVSTTRSIYESLLHKARNYFGDKPEKQEEFRFLLLGKTGSGKSSTGNIIFGEELFQSSISFASCTKHCLLRVSKKEGRTVEIMDSPGLYDTAIKEEEICTIIVQAVACVHPGPHAILYVIKLSRYTDEDFNVYKRLKALFDDNIRNYIILIITGGDQLEKQGKTLADLLQDAPKNLVQVVEECGNRALVFNNMAKNTQPQVDRLFEEVQKINTQNQDVPYTCPKYAMVGEGLEAEVARRLEAVTQRDLEREQQIKELEMKARQVEKEAEKLKKEFEEREMQREAQIEEERAKHKQTLREMEKMDKALMEKKEESPVIKQIQQESERDREELDKKMQEKERLKEEKREEEMKELARKQQAYEVELNRMKDAIAKNNEPGFVEWAASGITSTVAAPFKWVASWFQN